MEDTFYQKVIDISAVRKNILHISKNEFSNILSSYFWLLDPKYVWFEQVDDHHFMVFSDPKIFNDPWDYADCGCIVNEIITKTKEYKKKETGPGRKPKEIYDWAANEYYQNGRSINDIYHEIFETSPETFININSEGERAQQNALHIAIKRRKPK